MTWPIPQPADIVDRAAATFEQEFARVWALRNPSLPAAVVDARSPWSSLAIHAGVVGLTAYDIWLALARVSEEMMVDTASDWLPRHGQIWGVPRIAAKPAVGNAVFSGAGAAVPSGLVLAAPGGGRYATTAAVTIGVGGTASVPVQAAVAGAAGSLAAGTVLTVVNPLAGLTVQTATVDSGGLIGADVENLEIWRGRILARIRRRGGGGNASDFVQWTKEVAPSAMVRAFSPGVGFVTIAFAMPDNLGWRVPSGPEIAAVSAYVNDPTQRKPLGCPAVDVVAAGLQPVNVTVHLNPDAATTRAAATNALAGWFLADAEIGGYMLVSRLDAALSNGSGEFSHERALPAADVAPASPVSLPVLGTVTFT